MEVAVKIEHINKYFGKRQILHDISLETYAGEVFGFLGPNGAGKTTTIKMIVGMLHIDEGDISICGSSVTKDFEAALSNIGAIVENPEFYKYMSGLDNLKQYARMRKGVTPERLKEVIDIVGLTDRIGDKVGKYSLGMRQRLGVAQAIMHNPKVLILDEPTNGLDPAGIKQLRDLLRYLAHETGICVLVSSHLMSEMELMCDRVGIVTNGTLVNVTSVEELINQSSDGTTHYILEVSNASLASKIILEHTQLSANQTNSLQVLDNTHIELILDHTDTANVFIKNINKALIINDIDLYNITIKEHRNLEDAFIELTSKGGH
ncbi:MAG: ATP-binding cassette domain-containing protein [bacterium]|nr:ATP-binding cassette domain-containing protein [bacterium]